MEKRGFKKKLKIKKEKDKKYPNYLTERLL